MTAKVLFILFDTYRERERESERRTARTYSCRLEEENVRRESRMGVRLIAFLAVGFVVCFFFLLEHLEYMDGFVVSNLLDVCRDICRVFR